MYQGTETLPVKNTQGPLNPLWWASSINGNAVYLKVVNSGNASVPLTTQLDVSWSSVNGTIIVSGGQVRISSQANSHSRRVLI